MRAGFVGWRGMVGSVLMGRMREEGDFAGLEPTFFSTSQVGLPPPAVGVEAPPLADAYDLKALGAQEVIVTCQGSGYTKRALPELRASGWRGYWIDAASALRMEPDALIVLDPVNRRLIDEAIAGGTKDFIGGNCTVSLMLMGLGGLFEQGWVEWMSSMTYQAASGAGARNLTELVAQMRSIGELAAPLLDDPASAALELDRAVNAHLAADGFPTAAFGAPLAANLLPWIDSLVEGGATREEWKGFAETNKILGLEAPIPIDGLCVRVGALRCHSQAVTVKLTQDVPLDEISAALDEHNPWSRVVANDKDATLRALTPAAVTGTLEVPVGRLRKMRMGPDYLTAFTVGDQLLWGAAEPLRRMLAILRS